MMKILSDATTPFGRKCVVCAMERELEFEEVFVSIDDALEAANPLRQIPALSTGDGQTLYDSDV
ncbi:MAG: glutathione S-transferase, partial [Chromatiales bacterium]|nr:glutathione S-transferase [Chromatiales bacterium]